MSKRRSDTQLTKDDYEKQGFSYQGNHEPENERDAVDPTKMADSKIMSGRKIAPLKKGRGRGGPAGGSSKGGSGSNLPNFFAGTPTGGFGTNGVSQPEGGFSGFGTPQSAAPAAPTFGGNATGGFNFGGGSPAPEQPKVNPFASLTPSSTNGGFGTPQLGGLFGGSTPQSSSTGGMFGNNNNNNGNASPGPAPTGFAFGGSNSAAPAQPATGFKAPSFTFGGNSTAAPMFGAGDNKPAASASSSFTFGANNGTPAAVTPPATSSFTFGSSTATAGQPSGGYFGAGFASEKTPEPQATPAAAPAPTFAFGAPTPTTGTPSTSLFGKPADSQGKSLFAKPAEQQGSGLFGRPSHSPEPTSGNLFKPSPSPEPSNNLFGSPVPTPTTSSFFGQPKEQESKPSFGGFGDKTPVTPKHEPPKALFGFGIDSNTPQQEPPKSPFVGFGDNKTEPPKSPFFGGFGTASEKKDEPSKPLFGFGPPAENKPETPKAQSPFFGAPSTPSVEINDDIMADNSPPKSPSVFNQPINSPSPFTGFGSPKLAAAPPKESTPPPAMFAPAATSTSTPPPPASTSTPAVNNTTAAAATNFRTPSPPLPSDSTSWTTAQLNEYYNLFALRALNHSFLEGIKKADQMGDWSVSCEIYIKESKKIKECQQNGERYKGASVEPKLGSGVSAKRTNTYDDNEIQGGGGKRPRGNGEDSKYSGSDSSKALASILGDGASTDPYKLASKPTHGFVPPSASAPVTPAGVKLASAPLFGFKPPVAMTEKKDQEEKYEDVFKKSPAANDSSVLNSPDAPKNNGGFVNPFSSQVPGPLEKDDGDEDDDTPPAPSPSGSLFGRVSEPKKESTGSIFSNNQLGSGSGMFSSKFGETNGTNGTSLFGSKPEAPKGLFGSAASSTAPSPNASGSSSIFGTPGVKETGFSFGSNGTNTPSVPASGAVTPSEDNDSEPNDNAHLAKNNIDLSRQGPGEEDEDSIFEARAIVYKIVDGQTQRRKIGVGPLRVLKNRNTGKARVLARTDAIGKVSLNVGLVEGVAYTPPKGSKNISIVEFLPDGGREKYILRVKEEEIARQLGEAMDTAKMS